MAAGARVGPSRELPQGVIAIDREHDVDVRIAALAEEVQALTRLVEELRERVRSLEHLTGVEGA